MICSLSGFINANLLVFAALSIIWESIERVLYPEEIVNANMLLITSVGGLVVNIIGVVLLHGSHDHNGCGHNHGLGHNHSHTPDHDHSQKQNLHRSLSIGKDKHFEGATIITSTCQHASRKSHSTSRSFRKKSEMVRGPNLISPYIDTIRFRKNQKQSTGTKILKQCLFTFLLILEGALLLYFQLCLSNFGEYSTLIQFFHVEWRLSS